MTAAAHDAGLSVMAHVNGAQAVMDAAEAGVDSVEHGNFQNEESICCMAEHATIWVPTIVTVSNLLENGRYPALLREVLYSSGVIVSTSPFRRERSAANTRRVFSQEMPISLTSSAVFAPVM